MRKILTNLLVLVVAISTVHAQEWNREDFLNDAITVLEDKSKEMVESHLAFLYDTYITEGTVHVTNIDIEGFPGHYSRGVWNEDYTFFLGYYMDAANKPYGFRVLTGDKPWLKKLIHKMEKREYPTWETIDEDKGWVVGNCWMYIVLEDGGGEVNLIDQFNRSDSEKTITKSL